MTGREQLLLFDSAPSPNPAQAEGSPLLAPTPPHPSPQASAALQVPIQRPATLPAGCRWYEVETPLQTIGFMLRTSRRKTVGLTITDDGLMVTSPAWVPRPQLEKVIHDKATWIVRKLRSLHERQQHLATVDACWRDGGRFPYLGVKITLAIHPEGRTVTYRGDPRQPS